RWRRGILTPAARRCRCRTSALRRGRVQQEWDEKCSYSCCDEGCCSECTSTWYYHLVFLSPFVFGPPFRAGYIIQGIVHARTCQSILTRRRNLFRNRWWISKADILSEDSKEK